MDRISGEKRKKVMSAISGKNTKPEIKVRKLLFALGFRFRLHDKNLPGKPDIVLKKYKTVIFVHGCFWHMHPGCKRASIPKTNEAFWRKKLLDNVERDIRDAERLEKLGWTVFVIWECQVKNRDKMIEKIRKILDENEVQGNSLTI